MNIRTYVFVWVIVFNSLRCLSRSRILGYMVIICLTFWGNISLPSSFFFFLLIYLTFLIFFHSFLEIWVAMCSQLPWICRIPLSLQRSLSNTYTPFLFIWKCLMSINLFWRIIFLDTEFGVNRLSFHHHYLKYAILITSYLHWFQRKITY